MTLKRLKQVLFRLFVMSYLFRIFVHLYNTLLGGEKIFH